MDLGILATEEPDGFSAGDVRSVLMAKSLEDAGIPLEGLAAGIKSSASPSPSSTRPATSGSPPSQETGVSFGDIGPVELEGVSGTVHLLRAQLA